MRAFENDKAELFRLSSGSKTTYSSQGIIRGFLKVASDEQTAINNKQIGELYNFFSKFTLDVRSTDYLIVNGVRYNCTGATFPKTSAGHSRVVLELAVKA